MLALLLACLTMTPPADSPQPWKGGPVVPMPIVLIDAKPSPALDAIEMPAGSAMTIARVGSDGTVHAARWRESGTVGFYPASTVKLATAVGVLRHLDRVGVDLPLKAWRVSLQGDPLTGETPQPVATLLRDMIADSDNAAFNTLQEFVGFAETHAMLTRFGCEKLTIRRHFTRPHWNHSRPVTLLADDATIAWPARPAPDLPPNADPAHPAAGGGEANWACSDDLVRLLAATFFTETRGLRGFDALAQAMAETNEPFVERGLTHLNGLHVWNKPGWWPGDGAFVDAAYVFDATSGQHYLIGLYWQGDPDGDAEAELETARAGMARVAGKVVALLRADALPL